jgi:hypothetical protein
MSIDDYEIQRRLRLLPPPPVSWVQTAKELPFVQDEISQILSRAAADERFQQALRDDPGGALEAGGYELSEDVVAHMLRRLPPPAR